MSTHYEVLEVSESASHDHIKHRFQQLIMKHHPDKRTGKIDDDDRAHRILKAWEVLRDPESRKKYDVELQNQRNKKVLAISADVDLDDMAYDEEDGSYSFLCRCSGYYFITEEMLEKGVDIVGCNNCSLRIRVLYDVVEDEEDDE